MIRDTARPSYPQVAAALQALREMPVDNLLTVTLGERVAQKSVTTDENKEFSKICRLGEIVTSVTERYKDFVTVWHKRYTSLHPPIGV